MSPGYRRGAEPYPELPQMSNLESFTTVGKGFKPWTVFTKLSIWNVCGCLGYSSEEVQRSKWLYEKYCWVLFTEAIAIMIALTFCILVSIGQGMIWIPVRERKFGHKVFIIHFQPILAQCSNFIPPENVRKSKLFLWFSGCIKVENCAKTS